MPAEPHAEEPVEPRPEPLTESPAEPETSRFSEARLAEAAEVPAEPLLEEFAELPSEPLAVAPVGPTPLQLSEALLVDVAEEPAESHPEELAEPRPEVHTEAHGELPPLRLSESLLVEVADLPAEPRPEELTRQQGDAHVELRPLHLSEALLVDVAEVPAEPLPLLLTEALLKPDAEVPAEPLPHEPAPLPSTELSDTQAEPKPDRLGKRLRKIFGRFARQERPSAMATAMAEPGHDTAQALVPTQSQTVHDDGALAPDKGPFLLKNVVTTDQTPAGAGISEEVVTVTADLAPHPDVSVPGEDLAADLAEADEADLAAIAAELADLTDIDVVADPESAAEYPDYADLDEIELPAATLEPDEEAGLRAELAEIGTATIAIAEGAPTRPAGAHETDDFAGPERDSAPETETVLHAEVETAEAGFPETALDRAELEGQVTSGQAAGLVIEAVSEHRDDDKAPQELRSDGQGAAEPVGAIHQPTLLLQDMAEDRDDATSGDSDTWAEPDAALETVEDEIADESEGAETSVSSFPEREPLTSTPAAEHVRARFMRPEDDAAALDRLLSQTDAQMSGPEAARRRDAIAHLRAAVAASEAARGLGQAQIAKQHNEDGFRAEFRQVVQPRRPAGVHPVQRGERPRPSPLRLVASQRIDAPDEAAPATPAPVTPAAATQPIRPRRITIDRRAARDATIPAPEADNAPVAESDSFAHFAGRMGASSLTDLIEAAAAHTTYVEGIEDFSRPQILNKVATLTAEATQEEGLRAFGMLLREGRIMRSPRTGRFEVARDTRFHPERRAV